VQKDLACKLESDADLLMSTAFQLKYNARKMKKCVCSADRYGLLLTHTVQSRVYVTLGFAAGRPVLSK